MYTPKIAKQELLEQLHKHNPDLTLAELSKIIKMPESYIQREKETLWWAGRIKYGMILA